MKFTINKLLRCSFFKNSNAVFYISFSLGLILSVIGLSKLSITSWQDLPSFIKFFSSLIISNIIIFLISKITKKNLLPSTIILIIISSLIIGNISNLLFTILFSVSSIIIGNYFYRLLSNNDSPIYSFLIGSGFYAVIVSILSHFPINYPSIYIIIICIPLIIFRIPFLNYFHTFCTWFNSSANKLYKKGFYLDLFLCSIIYIYIIVAYLPELGHDALATHLFIPSYVYNNHQWSFNIDNFVWAATVSFGDWVYTLNYMLGGEISTRLVNVFYIFVTTCIASDIVKILGGDNFSTRLCQILILTFPLTFALGSSLFVESIWTCFCLASFFYILKLFNKKPNQNNIIFLIVFISLAIATKVITVVWIPIYLFLIVCIFYFYNLKVDIKVLFFSLLCGFFISALPYLVSYFYTSNPIFPFFNEFFKSPFYPLENFTDKRWIRPFEFDFFYRITFDSGRYLESLNGVGGFFWLILFLPVLLFSVFKNKKIIFISLISFSCIYLVFTNTAYLRYVFPILILLISTCCYGLFYVNNFNTFFKKIFYISLFTSIILNLLFLSSAFFVYRDFPLETILTKEHRDEYLSKKMPIRKAVDYISIINTNKLPIAVFGNAKISGISSDVYIDNWYNPKWLEKVRQISSDSEAGRLLSENNIKYIIIDHSEKKSPYINFFINASIELENFKNVSVRKLNSDFYFLNELLLSSDFSDLNKWNISDSLSWNEDSKFFSVNAQTPISQKLLAHPRKLYKLSIEAKSYDKTSMGRFQLVWLDKDEKVIHVDIEVFETDTQWKSYTKTFISPKKTNYAIVYGTSHSDSKISIKSISLK